MCGSRRGRKYRSVAGLGLSGDTGAKALVKRLGKEFVPAENTGCFITLFFSSRNLPCFCHRRQAAQGMSGYTGVH